MFRIVREFNKYLLEKKYMNDKGEKERKKEKNKLGNVRLELELKFCY